MALRRVRIGARAGRGLALAATALLVSSVGVAAVSPGAASVGGPPAPSAAAAAQPDRVVVSGAAREAGARATVPRVRWRTCPDRPRFDCARVAVPLDHDRPRARTTRIALVRWPAGRPRRRVGSVFVNPGGPGGSGVEMVLSGFGKYLGDQLRGRFDVVGFDPRGIGSSEPLHCFDSRRALDRFVTAQPVFPYLKDQYRPFFDHWAGLGPECRDDRQRIIRHMNTADVARDLDLLRRAVRDPRLTYLGFSYGSYLGTTYANLFPRRVRALAIDGVLDPRLWSTGRQIEADRVSMQEEFEEFLRLCDEAGPECAFATPAGSEDRWWRLAEAIRRTPFVLPDGTPYTYDLLIADVASVMYVPEVWGGPDGAAAFLDALADAVLEPASRPSTSGADVARRRAALVGQLQPNAREASYPNGLDGYHGNHCADAQYPFGFPTWVEGDRYASKGSQFGPIWWWSNTGCARWPLNQDRYAGPWRARTSAPVLVVGNYFDGVTDHAGAVAVADLLPRARLLSYAGWGHTAYGRNECVRTAVSAYLRRGRLPAEGTVCAANPNPFLPAAGRVGWPAPQLGLPAPWTLFR